MKQIDLKDLGMFIKGLRESKNLTQTELAAMLQTSQPVIARIERGEQNMTTQTMNGLSKAFDKPIVQIASKSIDVEINGGKELSGTIETNTSKNGAMGLLCAALLNYGSTTLHGVPRIEEVNRILEVMSSIGVKTKWLSENTLLIDRPKKLQLDNINKESASRTRTILMFIGAIIHEYDECQLPHSQGCTLGTRTITPHLNGLKHFGVNIEVGENSYNITSPLSDLKTFPDVTIVMQEASDTGAELLLIAAAKYPGNTTIKFAPSNYMVQEVCYFLQDLGVTIEGVGTHILKIKGLKDIRKNIEYYNSEDPIESMMFFSLAVCTKSELSVTRCPIDYLEIEIENMKQMGVPFTVGPVYKSHNGRTNLSDVIVHKAKKLVSLPDKITCGPYPALNIDNLPFFVPIACLAEGRSIILDWVYEVRILHFLKLSDLGADMQLASAHKLIIEGQKKFKPNQVACPPALRPAMIVLIAMLSAQGNSKLYNLYSIYRGYENIIKRLQTLGADINFI
jgi:UDP-N-acetylglucosamine 1-carboxyvinyltransferase